MSTANEILELVGTLEGQPKDAQFKALDKFDGLDITHAQSILAKQIASLEAQMEIFKDYEISKELDL
ncbi:MAG: hypothetical protein FWC00_03575 [Firmicutes bacterium]|nr:hypothetical protein [Bacillota bacterium]